MRSNISAAAQSNWGMVRDTQPPPNYPITSLISPAPSIYISICPWATGDGKELYISAQNNCGCKSVHVRIDVLCVSSYVLFVLIVKQWRQIVCFYGYNKAEKII